MKEEGDTERFRQEVKQAERYEEEPQYEDKYNLESNKVLRSSRTKRSDVTTLITWKNVVKNEEIILKLQATMEDS